eukprot:11620281-Alexandrium_andersonii.AAC.1
MRNPCTCHDRLVWGVQSRSGVSGGCAHGNACGTRVLGVQGDPVLSLEGSQDMCIVNQSRRGERVDHGESGLRLERG